jgi:hypothetical protein
MHREDSSPFGAIEGMGGSTLPPLLRACSGGLAVSSPLGIAALHGDGVAAVQGGATGGPTFDPGLMAALSLGGSSSAVAQLLEAGSRGLGALSRHNSGKWSVEF